MRDSHKRVHTRVATLADLDAVAGLFDAYRQFYEQAADPALAKRFIGERMHKRESVILLALGEGESVLGFCQLYPSFCSVEAKPIYVLYDLFVDPAARRSGAGKQLLISAERLAAANGMARLDLTTARTNLAAQTAYESLGWVRDDIFLAYNKAVPSAPR